MTCARAMLCDVHVEPDGRLSKPVEKASRCNLEGYGGVDYEAYGTQVEAALAAMPGGRCPVPPGDVPGPGPGFDAGGHYVGLERARATSGSRGSRFLGSRAPTRCRDNLAQCRGTAKAGCAGASARPTPPS